MIRVIVLLCSFFSTWLIAQPVPITMWHSLAGSLGEQLTHLVDGFNQSQQDYVVKLAYKGEYTDSLTSFAAAFRAKQAPDIVQVAEVGTATMLSPAGIIKPLDELMRETGFLLPEESFLPAVRAFYSKSGQLQAMPFNISIPVIFYNADALAKVGITDKKDFPTTWQELENLAAKLLKAGNACAYTSAYPAWIQIESFSALHGLPMVDVESRKAIYNNPAVIHHLERLRNWQAKHYFEYGGRTSDATILFTSGRCAMFSQSSGSYNGLASLVHFHLGVAPMPLDLTVSDNRHNNVIGGAALWAVSGKSAVIYRGIARFYEYLANVEVQKRWHQNTGYIPLGLSGYYATLSKGQKQSTLDLAQLDLAKEFDNLSGMYLIPQNQIRTINDEALEAIFAGIKLSKVAMDYAVTRANFALMRFARNTGETF